MTSSPKKHNRSNPTRSTLLDIVLCQLTQNATIQDFHSATNLATLHSLSSVMTEVILNGAGLLLSRTDKKFHQYHLIAAAIAVLLIRSWRIADMIDDYNSGQKTAVTQQVITKICLP